MTTKERIKAYLDFKGTSPTGAERLLGWGVGALTKAKSITADRLQEFLSYYKDLSAEWLLRGEGSMIKDDNAIDKKEAERLSKFMDTIALLQETINIKTDMIAKLQERVQQLETQLK